MKESAYLSKDTENMVAKLKRVPFLRDLGEGYLAGILPICRLRQYDPQEMIVNEGDKDMWIYILLSGKAIVLKGNQEIAYFDQQGTIFGEQAMINNAARSASVLSMTNVNCLSIDGLQLHAMRPPERTESLAIIYRLFSEILSLRLKTANEELIKTRQELEVLRNVVFGNPSTPEPPPAYY